jgi:Zn-dependent hydrolases, including glyoxylases
MANLQRRLPENAAGPFYVDSTCIDCDTCRQLAPGIFGDSGDYSFVKRQPTESDEERLALRALLACPTSSIGTQGKNRARETMEDFPLPIEGEVFYCGFNSEKSFGANSYFIQHPGGNWLIDAPRFLPFLVKKFTELGGIQRIFLTHRDDVADAAKYAEQFSSSRIIHEDDSDAVPGAEITIRGRESTVLQDGFVAIPTPGHTRGSAVLLYRDRFLFTGDHLAFSRSSGHLQAFRGACWYSWKEQTRSMDRLRDYRFEWVLAGHGDRVHWPWERMTAELDRLVRWMQQA